MQTALHIYALVKELNDVIVGGKFIAAEFYKKEREAYLLLKTANGTFALGLAYHPTGFGTFLIPRGKIEVKTKEKPWPFFQQTLEGEISSVEQMGLDRIIRLNLIKDEIHYSIVIEAIGPNGNLWLLDGNNKILATLRNKQYDPDTPYSPPLPLDRLNPLKFEIGQLKKLSEDQTLDIGTFLYKNFLGLDRTMVEEIAGRAELVSDLPVNELTDTEIERLAGTILFMAKAFNEYSPGYTHETPIVAPFKMHHLSGEWSKFKTLSLAVYDLVKNRKAVRAELSEKQRLIDAVTRFVVRQKRKIGLLEKDIESAGKFDLYRKYAEILKANLTKLKKGQSLVELEDFYNETGGTISIKLDPALSAADNADLYFKKYRKGKDALELLSRRLEIAKSEFRSAGLMLNDFETDFDSAVKKYETEILEILPVTETKRAQAPRLPYRPFQLASGVTIFVGKDGADNDTTTFRFAKPYELWFHASQCPGSHVVLKFPDKNFQPSKNEIAAAAAAAAFYSKAKNSKSVAVIYAERKYVHKPRGAKPGLVTVEREKMVMVIPKKPE